MLPQIQICKAISETIVIELRKRIEIGFVKSKVHAIAEMHEDLAPKTCEAVWNCLPHEGEARHAKWCGNEVWTMLSVSEALKKVPNENITIYPQPGDVMYGYFPPAWEGGLRGQREAICDVAIWYGPDSPLYQIDGPHTMNHFAKVVENLDKFAEECDRMWTEGVQRIAIKRL